MILLPPSRAHFHGPPESLVLLQEQVVKTVSFVLVKVAFAIATAAAVLAALAAL